MDSDTVDESNDLSFSFTVERLRHDLAASYAAGRYDEDGYHEGSVPNLQARNEQSEQFAAHYVTTPINTSIRQSWLNWDPRQQR